jgi:3-hydroxybutyryl-CoA dehydrogenase
MGNKKQLAAIEVGVVGLGLMGSSIVVALFLAGHKVKAIAPLHVDMKMARPRILDQLSHYRQSNLAAPDFEMDEERLKISKDYNDLKNCAIVLECVIEDIKIKAEVYKKIENSIKEDCVIATNTSAIAISVLQQLVTHPQRFLGVHWAEPAYATRFLEITCGEKTRVDYAEWIFDLAHYWGKEPTLLRKDIRGFITNRLMYSVYREIFSLVEKKCITIEDADKAFRYDVGSWITMMGIFRRMDYLGLKNFEIILKNILPKLSNEDKVPSVMQYMVDADARGTQNLKGLYTYTAQEAKDWEDAFARFNEDIFNLASCYPSYHLEPRYHET